MPGRALDSGKGKKVLDGRNVKPADVAGIVEDALEAWFGKRGAADAPGGRNRESGEGGTEHYGA